ncbi:MAG: hypothetical protein KC506_04060, partial [Nanoarchaeota archaeon]|nr:hypothetical protein [Nanoarchaeota archaeon]
MSKKNKKKKGNGGSSLETVDIDITALTAGNVRPESGNEQTFTLQAVPADLVLKVGQPVRLLYEGQSYHGIARSKLNQKSSSFRVGVGSKIGDNEGDEDPGRVKLRDTYLE